MKHLAKLIILVTALAVALGAPLEAFARNPLAPDTVLQGNKNEVQSGATFSVNGTLTVPNTGSAPTIVRKLSLGAPALASAASIVASTSLKVGSYTVADSTPDGTIPRNITVTVTAVSTADTQGTITVTGTDVRNQPLTETITPVAGSTVAGTKAFKTVTSVVGAGTVAVAGADSVTVGYGNLVGLPVALSGATGTTLATLGTSVAVYPTTGGTLQTSAVNASGGTYDGAKELVVYIDR